ncbi:hypothetical protein [Pollutimonas bauzanensis]|uniref:hypothetical protein n=1 Tax=Pollutimonas bauzanensis TaxID=658167 RepID=UPI00093371F4|nr:hypothetical protein [Pollutimonas bauzanensis]
MKARYQKYNSKRKILDADKADTERLAQLVRVVSYGGNPEHKKNPGDFGLTPPADPRQGKSLCDVANVFTRGIALELLRNGIRNGLVSNREEGGWPKNIWSVTESGIPLEAQLENSKIGSYHGYPMPGSDPLSSEVLSRWKDHG